MILRLLKLGATAWLVCLLCIQIFGQGFSPRPVQQQIDINTDRVEALDARVRTLEEMHIEGKLAQLQTMLEGDRQLLLAIAAAVAAMGLETTLRVAKGKKGEVKGG
jgi:hypothetical protein